MLERKLINESLQKTVCPKCGASLESARLVTITEAPTSFVAHAVCQVCKSESMVTITSTGSGLMPVQSDLTGQEFKKFMNEKSVSYDDVLNLHLALKKEKLWNLMDLKEKKQEKPRTA